MNFSLHISTRCLLEQRGALGKREPQPQQTARHRCITYKHSTQEAKASFSASSLPNCPTSKLCKRGGSSKATWHPKTTTAIFTQPRQPYSSRCLWRNVLVSLVGTVRARDLAKLAVAETHLQTVTHPHCNYRSNPCTQTALWPRYLKRRHPGPVTPQYCFVAIQRVPKSLCSYDTISSKANASSSSSKRTSRFTFSFVFQLRSRLRVSEAQTWLYHELLWHLLRRLFQVPYCFRDYRPFAITIIRKNDASFLCLWVIYWT